MSILRRAFLAQHVGETEVASVLPLLPRLRGWRAGNRGGVEISAMLLLLLLLVFGLEEPADVL